MLKTHDHRLTGSRIDWSGHVIASYHRMSAIGTSRQFAAPQKSVAIGGIADIRPGSRASMTLANMRANGVRTLAAWWLGCGGGAGGRGCEALRRIVFGDGWRLLQRKPRPLGSGWPGGAGALRASRASCYGGGNPLLDATLRNT